MKVDESIVKESILTHFHKQYGRTLMNNAANTCGIEETLSVASVFWPVLLEIEDCIFVEEFFYNGSDPVEKFHSLMRQFHEDKRQVELFANAWSLADFFFMADSPSVHDDTLITAFGEVLKFFWTMRLKTLFPERNFVVEVGDAIAGERGLTITFYQERAS